MRLNKTIILSLVLFFTISSVNDVFTQRRRRKVEYKYFRRFDIKNMRPVEEISNRKIKFFHKYVKTMYLDGKLSCIDFYYNKKPTGSIILDDLGRRIRDQVYNRDGSIRDYRVIKYNARSKIDKILTYDNTHKLVNILQFVYDKKGKLIKKVTKSKTGKVLYENKLKRNLKKKYKDVHPMTIKMMLGMAYDLRGVHQTLKINGKEYTNDCSGFVKGVFKENNIDLLDPATYVKIKSKVPANSSLTRYIFEICKEKGFVFKNKLPRPGDLIFFDNTYDRNKNRKLDDKFTHIGIVYKLGRNYTIYFVHSINNRRGNGRIIRLSKINLISPLDTRANSVIGWRIKHRRASKLFAGFARWKIEK